MICNSFLLCLFGISVFFVRDTVSRVSIVGGHKAVVDQFSYHVTVMVNGYDECGGGIIDKNYILTAAHCVIQGNNQFIKLRNLTVVAGRNDIRKKGKTVKIKRIFVPKTFDGSSNSTTDDIAVLKLKSSFKLSNITHMQKLELSKNNREIGPGTKVIITGFGWHWVNLDPRQNKVLHGGNYDTILRFANADILDNNNCQREYSKDNVIITEKEICARNEFYYDVKEHGTCKGDSGGPLVYNEKTIVGVLTRGSPTCNEKKKATIYTRVSHYWNFIENIIKGKETADLRVFPKPFFK